jgi:hypothetical protein
VRTLVLIRVLPTHRARLAGIPPLGAAALLGGRARRAARF